MSPFKPWRPAGALATGLAAALVLVSGCGSGTGESGGSGKTRTFAADNGSVTIPADPKRVVATGYAVPALIEADAALVGVSGWKRGLPMMTPEDRATYDGLTKIAGETAAETNYEAIAKVKPDLIVIGVPKPVLGDLDMNRLKSIAPVVAIGPSLPKAWRDLSRRQSDAAGRLANFETRKAAYEKKAGEIKAKYKDALAGLKFGHVGGYGDVSSGTFQREFAGSWGTNAAGDVGVTYYGQVKKKGGGSADVSESPSIEELPESLGEADAAARRHARPGREVRARLQAVEEPARGEGRQGLRDPLHRGGHVRLGRQDPGSRRPGARAAPRPVNRDDPQGRVLEHHRTGTGLERIPYPIGIRAAEIVRREELTPRMLRLTLGGPGLDGLHTYQADDHVRIVFPDPDGTRRLPVPNDRQMLDWPRPFPTTRKYTIRRYDAAARELDLDFVLHEGGLASEWAAGARIGEEVAVAGPPGAKSFPHTYDHYVFAVDSTALPALGRWLDESPAGVSATAVVDGDEDYPLASREGVRIVRGELGETVQGLRLPEGRTFLFAAGEAGALKPLRAWSKGRMDALFTGYWKRGVAGLED
jgi:iron complex transport system substrate-binding protein